MPTRNVIKISASDLAEAVSKLPAPLILTKNKNPDSAKNYRANPARRGQWLDGFWKGAPRKVEPGCAFAAHYVERNAELRIGRYLGSVYDEARESQSLIVDMLQRYQITDPVGATTKYDVLKRVLKKPGSVIYSYYCSSLAKNQPITEARFAKVRVRIEQTSFRAAVLAACGHRCVITGCDVVEMLDAAHLPGHDWRAGHNLTSDGIVLRVDLHRALDAGLIELDAHHRLTAIDPKLKKQYGRYQ